MADDNDNNDNNQTSGDEEESGEVERLRKREKKLEAELEALRNKNKEKEISDTSVSDTSVLKIVSLATIGYTPQLLEFTKGERRLSPKFFFLFFLFLVDFADAVFDLILSVRTMMFGTEGAGVGLGVLLFIATILGRVVSALYGWSESKDPPDTEEGAFVTFAVMEMVVFFLEDGAAILVLANSTGGMTIVETISMWLTMICGVCYIEYYVFGQIRDYLKGRLDVFVFLLTGLLPGGSAIFQVYILITEVILSKDDDPPLSGGLEIAAFVVYGITAVLLGGFTILVFAGV